MKKRQISIPRMILFFLGLVLMLTIFQILKPEYLSVTWRGGFLAFSLTVLYIVYTLPLVFIYSEKVKNGGLFEGAVIYYRGAHVYAVISLALMGLTIFQNLPMKLAISGELIAIFIFLVYLYLSFATNSHIVAVGEQEMIKLAVLDEVKTGVMQLQTRVGMMGPEFSEIKDRINALAEDLQYLSPSAAPQAQMLENQMRDMVNSLITADIVRLLQTGSANLVSDRLTEIETIYKMRKNTY